MPRHAALPDLSPARLDLDVYQGDRLSLLVQCRSRGIPINVVEGWEFEAHIRGTPDGELLGFFDVTLENVGPVMGVFRMQLSEDVTQMLPAASIWDLQSIDPVGRTRTLLRGNLVIPRDVTHRQPIGGARRG